MTVNNQSTLCSCIYCREVKSSKGIFTHVDRTHLHLTKYSSGFNGKYAELSAKHRSKIEQYLLTPARCKECNKPLEFNKKSNKFCSASCAAKFSNARKDYTTFKPGPAKSKQLVSKCCPQCGVLFETYKQNKTFCGRKCAILHKNAPLRANRTAWQNYRADCQFRFSLKDYPNEFNFSLLEEYGWYKAANRGNNLSGVSRDHMVSCRYGFDNNLPVEHIQHPANCCLLVHKENVSKNKSNSISYEELLHKIKEWDKKYPP
jgi:hypothetical protein